MQGEGSFHWQFITPGGSVPAPLPGYGRLVYLRRGALLLECGNGARRLTGEWLVFFPCGNRESVGGRETFGSIGQFDDSFLARVNVLLDSAVIRRFRTDGAGIPDSSSLALSGESGAAIRAVLAALAEECGEPSGPSTAILCARFVELLTLAERLLASGPQAGGDVGAWQVRDLSEWLETHYAEPVSLDDLARKYGISPTQLSRSFSEQSGVTLFEHLNRLRIAKACQLLKRGQLPILDISLAVGYRNLSFFNRYFRRVTGMAPREYRLRMQA
ncbi:MAG: helix-turn-helix transcriptional regulator [Spirochaetes bacterium]|nr:helix-turn-helix transcriptional regulator [Spirochaetota bacterium]